MSEPNAESINSKKLAVGGLMLFAAAAAITVVVGIVSYNEGKKSGKKNCTPASTTNTTTTTTRKYNFYPGLDAYNGMTAVRVLGSLQQLKNTCDSSSSCKGFNSNGYVAKTILPTTSWYGSRGGFAPGSGSYIADDVDPYGATKSPTDSWVYFPGCSLDGLQTPVMSVTNPDGTSPTLSDLKTYAVSKGYYAFSDNGNMYNTALPVKSKWLTNTEHSLYVMREHMPLDA